MNFAVPLFPIRNSATISINHDILVFYGIIPFITSINADLGASFDSHWKTSFVDEYIINWDWVNLDASCASLKSVL
jgi:hypothetical protein